MTVARYVGYARVSASYPDAGLQERALMEAGAQQVFTDASGPNWPQWRACRDSLRPGDTLLVWRLDRIPGRQSAIIAAVHHLTEQGVQIKSVSEPVIDTTTATGRTVVDVVATLAQLHGNRIREETREGLARARAEGRVGGRPTVMTPSRTREAARMRAEGQSLDAIAAALGVGRSTVSRALNRPG